MFFQRHGMGGLGVVVSLLFPLPSQRMSIPPQGLALSSGSDERLLAQAYLVAVMSYRPDKSRHPDEMIYRLGDSPDDLGFDQVTERLAEADKPFRCEVTFIADTAGLRLTRPSDLAVQRRAAVDLLENFDRDLSQSFPTALGASLVAVHSGSASVTLPRRLMGEFFDKFDFSHLAFSFEEATDSSLSRGIVADLHFIAAPEPLTTIHHSKRRGTKR